MEKGTKGQAKQSVAGVKDDRGWGGESDGGVVLSRRAEWMGFVVVVLEGVTEKITRTDAIQGDDLI